MLFYCLLRNSHSVLNDLSFERTGRVNELVLSTFFVVPNVMHNYDEVAILLRLCEYIYILAP